MTHDEERLPEGAATPASSDARAAHRRKARAAGEDGDGTRSAPLRAALGRGALRTASRLSFRAVRRLGGAAGALLARTPSRERHATRLNLEICLPELDAAARERLARASLVETGRTFLEFGALWCWERERVLALVREVRGREVLDAARALGRGVIAISPHLGAWELAGLYLGAQGPLTALYKPPPIREMEAFYTAARARTGARLAAADAAGVRLLHRALHRREMIGILPDQDPGRGSGIFVPFFGVPANTSTLAVKLGNKTGAPFVFVWAERLEDGSGFRVHLRAAQEDALHSDDVEAATAALNREVERMIRSAPAQYLWSYKRFSHRPPGQVNPYRHGLSERTIGARR